VRTTLAVDMVAELEPGHVAPFVAGLADRFYVDEVSVREAVKGRTSFNLFHLETMVKVDVFLPKERPFDRQQLARRIAERVNPDSTDALWILTAEDVILAKLDWFRMGGEASERQWRDVLGVMKTQGDRLDVNYLLQWAEQLRARDLLEQALDEADIEGAR
jgi:hypothetical protein